MKMREFEYWRFAMYGASGVYTTMLPENLKLFCLNPDSTISFDKDGKRYRNLDFLGIIDFSESVYNYYFSEKQSVEPYNCDIYNLNNRYLIFHFEQIFPLCEYNSTDIYPQISGGEKEYVRIHSTSVNLTNKEILEILDECEEMGLDGEDKEQFLQKKLIPVIKYIRIEGIDSGATFQVTELTVANCYGEKRCCIEKTRLEIDFLNGGYKQKIKSSSKKEFQEVLEEMKKELGIC